MCGRWDINEVERGSTFTLCATFHTVYIASINFCLPCKIYVRMHVKITRQWKSILRI